MGTWMGYKRAIHTSRADRIDLGLGRRYNEGDGSLCGISYCWLLRVAQGGNIIAVSIEERTEFCILFGDRVLMAVS